MLPVSCFITGMARWPILDRSDFSSLFLALFMFLERVGSCPILSQSVPVTLQVEGYGSLDFVTFSGKVLKTVINAGINPLYSVKYYREGFYKLIRFNNALTPRLPSDGVSVEDRGEDDNSGKLSQALSRARSVVFQLALCNDWDFFFTGTIDGVKFNRYDLNSFYSVFSQWVRDQRKKYDCRIQYVLIPEMHKDGAWHLHGLVRGIPDFMVCDFVSGFHPQELIDKGFKNWPLYSEKFGFCSLAPIRDIVGCAHYVTKYITKDMASSVSDFGAHTYYCSIGLNRAVPLGYIFQPSLLLDGYISHVNEFCSTGYVTDVDWWFWLPYLGVDEILQPITYPEDSVSVLTNVSFEELQLSLFDLGINFAG